MESISNVPFVRFVPAFCIGIVIGFHSVFGIDLLLIACLIFLVVGFVFHLHVKAFRHRWLFGLIIQFLFCSVAALLVELKNTDHDINNFSTFSSVEKYGATIQTIVNRNGRQRAEVEVNYCSVGDELKRVTGGVLVYFPKNDSVLIRPGDQLVFNTQPVAVPGMKNPGQFDWQGYLAFKRIHHQIFLKKDDFVLSTDSSFSVFKSIDHLRNKGLVIFHQYIKNQEFALLSALVFGYDDEIDVDVVKSFAASGTLHILSVSGMHVAIIYTTLLYALKIIFRKRKGKWLRYFILLISLWMYALLTGFSPSVIRSAMMFTILLTGTHFSRHSNVYNSMLAAALFIFLLIDPLLIFFPGFQLSFLAVTGIVFLFPLIHNWFIPSNKIIAFFWSLIAVSIAAQIATLPVSLYYFHQFPNYFILANVIILPLSTLVIYGGILLVFISPLSLVINYYSNFLSFVISLLRKSAELVERLPFAVTDRLVLDRFEMVVLFILFYSLVIFFRDRSVKALFVSGCSVVLFLSSFIYHDIVNRNRKELIFYSTTSITMFQYTNGFKSIVFYKGDSLSVDQLVQPYIRSIRSVYSVDKICLDSLESHYYSSPDFMACEKLVCLDDVKIALTKNIFSGVDYALKEKKRGDGVFAIKVIEEKGEHELRNQFYSVELPAIQKDGRN